MDWSKARVAIAHGFIVLVGLASFIYSYHLFFISQDRWMILFLLPIGMASGLLLFTDYDYIQLIVGKIFSAEMGRENDDEQKALIRELRKLVERGETGDFDEVEISGDGGFRIKFKE